MSGFKKFDGKKGFKGAKRGSFGDSRKFKSTNTVMHEAVCKTCKKSCQVPFLPSSDKPIYCRDCFAGRAALGGDRSSFKERKFPLAADRTPQPHTLDSSGGHGLKKQVEAMNAKLDRLVQAVEALIASSK